MRLDRLFVKNYKVLKNIDINFDNNITLIIGKNGSGKSQVLETLELFFNYDDLYADMLMNDGVDFTVTLHMNKSDYKFIEKRDSNILYKTNLKYEFRIKKYRRRKFQFYINNIEISDEIFKKIIMDLQKKIPCLNTGVFGNHEKHVQNNLKKLLLKIKASESDIGDKELLQKINEKLESRIDVSLNIDWKVDYEVKCNIFDSNCNESYRLEDLNSGYKKELLCTLDRMIEEKMLGQKAFIVLNDEIEIHYHPSMQLRKFKEYNRNQGQYVVTSHSRELLDYAASKKVYLIDDGTSTEIPMLDKEWVSMMDDTHINGKIWFADFVIFVEGKTDHFFWNKIIEREFENENIEVISMSSKNNVKKILDYLGDKINYIIVVDRDFKNAPIRGEDLNVTNEIVRKLNQHLGASIQDAKLYVKQHGYKKERVLRDTTTGLPKYHYKNTKNFKGIIKNDYSNNKKVFVWDHDLEHEILSLQKGWNSVRKVCKITESREKYLLSHGDISLRCKKKIIEIIDDWIIKKDIVYPKKVDDIIYHIKNKIV